MPLALIVDALESVPEALRGEYTAKDGKFHLNVDGLPDVNGLKNTVTALRGEKDALDKLVKDWAKLGKKPDEVEAMLAAERAEKEAALLKAGKFPEVLATHLGEAKKERDEAVSAEQKKAGSALAVARKAITDTGLATELAKAKATPEGMAALSVLLANRVNVDFDDKHETTASIFASDGKTPMFGEGGKAATFADLVADAKKAFPSLFEGSGAGGGGADPKNRQTGNKAIARSEWDKLGPFEQAAKIKEGFKPVD